MEGQPARRSTAASYDAVAKGYAERFCRELEAAGFAVSARLERASYPEELETHRAHLLSWRLAR